MISSVCQIERVRENRPSMASVRAVLDMIDEPLYPQRA
jgi:hypothetical protein